MSRSTAGTDAVPSTPLGTGESAARSVTTPLLTARGLGRTYTDPRRQGKTVALGGVDLAIAAGERLAIVGRSGSGKSTLARLLALHERPDAGRIRIGDRDPWTLPPRERRRLRPLVQLIHQDPSRSLDPRDTVTAALHEPLESDSGWWARRSRRGDHGALVRSMLSEVALAPSLGGQRIVTLSGGQKRRVAIARALLAGPRVLILDEALSSLDLSLRARVAGLFDAVAAKRGLSLVVVTHDLRVAVTLADRLLVLESGRVVDRGDLASVSRTPVHRETRALFTAAGWSHDTYRE